MTAGADSSTRTQRRFRFFGRPGPVMGAGRLVIAGLGLLATPLLTRILDAPTYGTLATIIAVVAISSTVPSQWLNSAILRYGPGVPQSALKRAAWLGSAICAGPAILIAVLILQSTLTTSLTTTLLVSAYVLTEAWFATFWIAARAQLRAWTYVIAGILRNGMSLVVIVTILALGHSADSLTLILCALLVASACGVAFLATRTTESMSEHVRLREWFAYGWPLILNYGLGLAYAYVNRFLLLSLEGRAAVGRFAPTYDVMYSIITLTVGMVGLTTVPRLFAATAVADQRALLRTLQRRVIAATVVVTAAMVAAWPWASRILIGPQVRVTDWSFTVLLGLSFALLAYRFQYLNVRVQLQERTMLQTGGTAAGLLAAITVGLATIPSFGIQGAAIATFTGASTAAGGLAIVEHMQRKRTRDGNAT